MQPLYPNRINWQNLPSFDTPLGASNLNKMDYAIYGLDQRVLTLTGYQDSASQSAKNAKASEVSAKTSELNASASEEMARQYAEQAFSGTPEGYEQLVEDVRLMDIQTTTDTTLDDSKAGGYKLVSMSGNSVQNGEPTPDFPVAIENVGDCVEMIQGAYSTSTGVYVNNTTNVCNKNNISCVAGDIINIKIESGAKIAVIYYNQSGYLSSTDSNELTATFTVPSNATYFNYTIYDANGLTIDTVGKISLTINGKYVVQVKTVGKNLARFKDTTTIQAGVTLTIKNGVAVATGTSTITSGSVYTLFSDIIDPSLLKDGHTYHSRDCSFRITNKDGSIKYDTRMVYDSNTIRTVEAYIQDTVSSYKSGVTKYMRVYESDPNIPFEPYHESIATILLDEPPREGDVLFNENGLWKVERNMIELVFDGSDDELWKTSSALAGRYFIQKNILKASSIKGMCTQARIDVQNTNTNSYFITNISQISINTEFATFDEWKAHLQEKPITFICELATPTIEVLDTASQIALNSLETFDTVTYINVDSRVPPSEIKGKYGTSEVGALTLKNELRNDTLEIKYNELAVALVATGSEV